MRAKEFIRERERTDEVLPLIGALAGAALRGGAALGGAALRGAASLGGAAVRGVTSAVPKIAQGAADTAKTIGANALKTAGTQVATSAANSLVNKVTGGTTQTAPSGNTKVPANTEIKLLPSKSGDKPGSARFNIGGAEVVLDDPKAIQQLNMVTSQVK